MAIVVLAQKTGYTPLSAQQTEADLGAQEPATADETTPPKSRVNFYLGHLAYCTAFFPAKIRYVVANGFYSKYKWVTGVVQLGFHFIGRLRSDANLNFLYDGPQKRRGNRRRYDGKVNLADPSRFMPSTQSGAESAEPVSFSMASFKRQALNQHLLDLSRAC